MAIWLTTCEKDLARMKEDLICTMKNMLKWFRLNNLRVGDKTSNEHLLKIDLTCVQSSDDVNLLGLIIDEN